MATLNFAPDRFNFFPVHDTILASHTRLVGKSHRIFYNFLPCRGSNGSFVDSNLFVSKLGSVAQGHGSWYLGKQKKIEN